ncbi:unnamed protein product [Anisakis simplex]|uniref:AHD domain-containing protein n=1 Tax=Anisakis simplex TaxID=6269 RepID=A0A0M3JUQ4_ANISI|nr:unnamed protein product [Anisakis simplex]
MLDRPTPQGHTHRWTVFVRSAGQHQFTDRTFIKKVTETGYAGFSIPISVSFSGTSKVYRLYYDMNLCLEKQSEHKVEQILEIKQPSKSFYELIMKYGGVVKKGERKEKHRLKPKQMPTENTNEKEDDCPTEDCNKKREKSRDHQLEQTKNRKDREFVDCVESRTRRERDRELLEEEDTISRKETEQQRQSTKERAVDEKSGIEMRKNSEAKDENERRKEKESSRRVVDNESCQATAISSARSNKVTPRSNNDRISSNSEREKVKRSKANNDETESVVAKKSRMDDVELESLKALQRKLMTICDVERLQAIVEAVIASGPTSGLQMARMCLSEDNFLSFDLCALSTSLLSQFEEICSKQV